MDLIPFTTANLAEFLEMSRDMYDSPAVAHPVSRDIFIATFRACLAGNQNIEGRMICENGENIGYLLLAHSFSTEIGAPIIMIEELYLLPEARGRHIGRAILEALSRHYQNRAGALKLDTSITGDILALRQTLSGGDYSAAESDLAQLKAAVLKRDHSYTSQEDIQAEIKSVESDIQSQKAKLSGARSVTAKASGTYSAVCDGYESVLTEEFLEELTPSKLDGVRAAEEQSNVGKLIYGDTWYYAVVLPEEQAAELKTMGSINVRLAKGFDQTIRMSVESVSRPDGGRCAVVLSSTRYLAQTTLLRHQAADAVLHTYEGLRVPADALRVSEDGVTGVYCVDGENAAFRPVTLVYQGEGYALVKPAEGAGDTRTLRAGDQVIATSGQLHDGQVIR